MVLVLELELVDGLVDLYCHEIKCKAFGKRAKAGGRQAQAVEGGWLTGDVVPCINFARTVRTDWAVRRGEQRTRSRWWAEGRL